MINLNVGTKIVKHLEENTGENLCDFKLDKDVLNMISKEKKSNNLDLKTFALCINFSMLYNN